MRAGLFRQQALDHQYQRLSGNVLLTPQLPYFLITGGVLAWLIVLTWFVCTHQYSRHATVTGWLEPDSGQIRLHAQRQGVVQQVLVSPGFEVTAGAPLMMLDDAQRLVNGQSIQARQIAELVSQANRLQSQKNHLIALFKQQRRATMQRITSLASDRLSLQQVVALAERRVVMAREQQSAMRTLHQHRHVADRDLVVAAAETLLLEQELEQLRRELTTLVRQHVEATMTLATLPDEHAQQRLALDNDYSDIQQRILQLESQQRTVIVAPRKGVISHIDAHAGQQLAPGQVVMTLTPADASIEAKMVVPARAAGFLSAGQQVAIRYDAFPYQKYGMQQGLVRSVSATLVLPGDWPDAPVAMQEPGYLVRVTLTQANILANGRTMLLKSGMTFSAEIKLGQRTLLEWLFEPLLSMTGRWQS